MADDVSPNFGFIEPEVTQSNDTWGNKLNNDLNLIDRLLGRMIGASAATSVTVASGAITPNAPVVVVDTEGAASTDDLTDINLTNLNDDTIMWIGTVTGTFQAAETITGGTSSASATIVSVDDSYTEGAETFVRLTLSGVTGTFTDTETITGGTSSASGAYDDRIPAFTGGLVILRIANDARNIVVKNSGNLSTYDGNDLTLDTTKDYVAFNKVGSNLVEFVRSSSLHGALSYLDTVGTSQIDNDAVTVDKIADGAVGTSQIAADAVNGDKIADDSIDSEHYVDGSIDTVHLAGDAVTGDKIADNTVDSEHYVDGSIDTAHIGDDQVTYAKVQDVSAGARLLGRSSSSSGIIQEINPSSLTEETSLASTDWITIHDTLTNELRAIRGSNVGAGAGGGLTVAQAEGHIFGLTISNNSTDSDHDIDIATGLTIAVGGGELIELSSALVKRIDAAWSVGTNQGGLDTGSVAADTGYAVWLIKRTDSGVVDVLFSTAFVSGSVTMPASYDEAQLIGWVMTDSSSNIVPFYQNGDNFTVDSVQTIVNDSTMVGDTFETVTTPLPPHSLGDFTVYHFNDGTGAANVFGGIQLRPTDGSRAWTADSYSDAVNYAEAAQFGIAVGGRALCPVNGSSQVDYAVWEDTNNSTATIAVRGCFMHERGAAS